MVTSSFGGGGKTSIGASIRIGREIRCLPYAGLLYSETQISCTFMIEGGGQFLMFSDKGGLSLKKSRIRETKHLSTDADRSTDTTAGWTKNTQKPKKFEIRKKSSKTEKLKNI